MNPIIYEYKLYNIETNKFDSWRYTINKNFSTFQKIEDPINEHKKTKKINRKVWHGVG